MLTWLILGTKNKVLDTHLGNGVLALELSQALTRKSESSLLFFGDRCGRSP